MSGRKSNKQSYETIVAGDMSLSSITSQVSNILQLDDVGYQFNFTGSPVGTFQIQISADYAQDTSSPPNVTNAGNWVPLIFTYWDGAAFQTTSNIPTTVGSPIYLDMPLMSAPWIRAVYQKVSGSGTLTAFYTAKMA